MKKIRRALLWFRISLLGLFLLLLSSYILLATGFLGELPGTVVELLILDELSQITFKGLSTDIFWNTSADSVMVYDSSGLQVTVCGVDIHGSLLDFLLNRHVGFIVVEELHIDLPQGTDRADSPPDSLSVILTSIDTGIVTSTERLVLEYGRITDPFGVVIDSMYLDASINRDGDIGVSVDAHSARVELPGFGGIRGNGMLTLKDGNVVTSCFTGIASPGSLMIAGTLNGAEETLNIHLSGRAGTAFLDSPVDLSVLVDGSISGQLGDLQASLAFNHGEAFMFDREAYFEADTIIVDLRNMVISNLHLVTDNASLNLDGSFDIITSEWNAVFNLVLTNADISEYFSSMFPTDVSGEISAVCSGLNNSDINGSVSVDLSSSSIDIMEVSVLNLDAAFSENNVVVQGSVSAGSESVTFSCRGFLGSGWEPESWSAEADASIGSLSFLENYGIDDLPSISGANLSVAGRGTRFDMDISGDVLIEGFAMNDISADRTSIQGSMNISRGILTASTSLLVDSLRFLSDAFHTTAEIDVDRNNITVNGLTLAGSNDRIYTAEIDVSTGDVTRFNMEDIRASHSKLRVVTDGGMSGFEENGSIVLDTLWIDPPVGEFGMSGIMNPDSMSFQIEIDNFDLTTFSTFSGLPADMSGLGNFLISFSKNIHGVQGSLTGKISDPIYGQFIMDSIIVDISADKEGLVVNGIYAWLDGVRSGFQMTASNVWSNRGFTLFAENIDWLEMEVNNIGDWLFYILPLPIRTLGASVSARAEYIRTDNGDPSFEMQASARINRLYVTILGIELLNVNFYLNYPDSTEYGYNARLVLGAGTGSTGNFSSQWFADIRSIFPFELGNYSISAVLSEMEIPLPGIGTVVASGGVSTGVTGVTERALFSGKLTILEGAIGVPHRVTASSSGGSGELPFDLAIDVSSTGSLWFRTSYADIEMALKMRILTLEHKPTVNGFIEAIRGKITILQRDFEIVKGRLDLIQGIPPTLHLNVTAETTVRSIMNRDKYKITILISGDINNPDIMLTGEGPSGQIAQEDILTLLATGLTYGEMQQLNSAALRTEVESMAQTMLGNLLARNIRHEIGLDTFEISPELLSDTTIVVLNVGKYVLPNLYVSYKGDVFSADPGTFGAQYLFSSDFYVEGTTRSTIHGNLEPTLELHYTIRY